MAIPETQLTTWAKQGAIKTSASTYDSIKKCIDGNNWKDDINYEIYLQGSYKNSTNIYGNSDVDIVVQFNSIFSHNISSLPEDQRNKFHSDFSSATYTLAAFKQAIIKRLKSCYGDSAVVVGDKSIKVAGNGSNRLDADVVVCNKYRKYRSYSSTGSPYVEGIKFKTERTSKTVINYPKEHYNNGVEKNRNERTRGNFKSVVRIFKNIKARLVSASALGSSTAPSYFVECLIYNVLDPRFQHSSYQAIMEAVLTQLATDEDAGTTSQYLVQNEQRLLFGTSDQQWNRNDAREFILKVIKLWNDW